MKFHLAALLGVLLLASPANAERLKFDHRLSPSLKAVFDANDPGMIAFNDTNPRYVTDLIAIEGASAQDRIVAGKRSLFLLGFMDKGELTEQKRREWQAVLASATID